MIIKALQIPHHGRMVNGNLYLPDTDGVYPLIIMGHGYNGNKLDFDLSAKYFCEHKTASFLFDFCGGSTRDESALKTTDMTLFTEKEDVNAILDAAIGWENVDKDNIYLFGASQGGLVAALTANERVNDLKGLILLFPALCIPDNWNERYKKEEDIPEETELWGMSLGRNFFMTLRNFNVFEHMAGFDKKVLIMHGDKDDIVLIDYSKKAEKIYKNVRLEVFAGEGHGFTPEGNKRMTEMALDFMQS